MGVTRVREAQNFQRAGAWRNPFSTDSHASLLRALPSICMPEDDGSTMGVARAGDEGRKRPDE